jgi:hypothetical protein
MASTSLYKARETEYLQKLSKFGTIPNWNKEEAHRRDGVAANGYFLKDSIGSKEGKKVKVKPLKRRMQVAGLQPFYIPAKVPEQDELHMRSAPLTVGEKGLVLDPEAETVTSDMDYEADKGTWISAPPVALESRTSLATTSTLVDERLTDTTLLIDTSIASSADSIFSSTTNSTDVYGWEEELDRKTSLEGCGWERDKRRLPSGGRTMGPRVRREGHQPQCKWANGKRRNLLYRVLNLSSSHKKGTSECIIAGNSPANESEIALA